MHALKIVCNTMIFNRKFRQHRCVRCACQVPNCADVASSSQDPFNGLISRSYFRSESR